MDIEPLAAGFWVAAAVVGSVGALATAIQVVGMTIDSPFDLLLTLTAVFGVLVWSTYCTFRVQRVNVPSLARVPPKDRADRW